jgi:hypothetical protein
MGQSLLGAVSSAASRLADLRRRCAGTAFALALAGWLACFAGYAWLVVRDVFPGAWDVVLLLALLPLPLLFVRFRGVAAVPPLVWPLYFVPMLAAYGFVGPRFIATAGGYGWAVPVGFLLSGSLFLAAVGALDELVRRRRGEPDPGDERLRLRRLLQPRVAMAVLTFMVVVSGLDGDGSSLVGTVGALPGADAGPGIVVGLAGTQVYLVAVLAVVVRRRLLAWVAAAGLPLVAVVALLGLPPADRPPVALGYGWVLPVAVFHLVRAATRWYWPWPVPRRPARPDPVPADAPAGPPAPTTARPPAGREATLVGAVGAAALALLCSCFNGAALGLLAVALSQALRALVADRPGGDPARAVSWIVTVVGWCAVGLHAAVLLYAAL